MDGEKIALGKFKSVNTVRDDTLFAKVFRSKKIGLIILLVTVFYIFSGFKVNVSYSEEEIRLRYVSDQGRDTEGDSLFDYLEIILEANISSSGIYIVESPYLLDSSGEEIAVTAYNRLFLEAGEHVITILFEGRKIHSSGFNPANIAYVGLISEDYTLGDVLNNIPLSREYRFTEFESPPDYRIGVKKGDWARYRVLHLWSSTDPSVNDPGGFPDEILSKVKEIKNQIVTIEMNFTFDEGINSDEAEGYLEQESQIFPFLLPADLSIGDSISQQTDAKINVTRVENVLGRDRKINHFHTRDSILQADAEIILEQEYLWDRETGILINSWFNMTMNDFFSGYTSYSNFSFSIYSTSSIPQKTSMILEVPSEIKVGETINITAILLDFHNEGIDGEQIILMSANNDNELGEGRTDMSGYVKFEYSPENPGEHGIKTVFMGSAEFLSSENSTLFTVTGRSNTQYLLWIAALFSIIVVILLYYMRDRIF